MYVQEVIRELHKKKILTLFIKLDISKAFDTLNCPCLLDILAYLGFEKKKMEELDLFTMVHSLLYSSP
jgi:hypothetical protein